MDMVSVIISLVSGLIGGNVAGAAAPDKSLGAAGNSVTGLIGGGIGGYILQVLDLFKKAGIDPMAAASAHGLDIGQILANVGSSGIGGALLMLIVGFLKNSMQKQ